MEKESVEVLASYACGIGLDHDEDFALASEAELAQAYNGIGPEWLPSSLRDRITERFEDVAPACLIHDWDYAHGDGTRSDFYAANFRLRDNIYKIAGSRHTPIISWGWWKLRLIGKAFCDACNEYGWTAYKAACGK